MPELSFIFFFSLSLRLNNISTAQVCKSVGGGGGGGGHHLFCSMQLERI